MAVVQRTVTEPRPCAEHLGQQAASGRGLGRGVGPPQLFWPGERHGLPAMNGVRPWAKIPAQRRDLFFFSFRFKKIPRNSSNFQNL
jgi:hypothetical protein